METIYAIRSGPYIKIGITGGDVNSRMSSLQTGNPHKLKVSFARAVDIDRSWNKYSVREMEMEIHRRLDEWRAEGEWFMIPPAAAEEEINEVVDEMIAEKRQPPYGQVQNSRIVSISISNKAFDHLTSGISTQIFLNAAINEKLERDDA